MRAAGGADVVSGLAMGIDAAAHLGNAEAGGKSVAVLGCGIDRIYPASSNAAAYRILAAGGCILGEYGCGVPPTKYNFPERNRIISGLCRATVVIEAPDRSGALITADFALNQGRDLFVHAGVLDSRRNGGCRKLAFDGAPAVSTASEVLREGDTAVDVVRKNGIMPAGADGSAELLEREIKGELVRYAGEYFEK